MVEEGGTIPDRFFHSVGYQDTTRQEIQAKVIVFLHLAYEKLDDFL